jgi:hypothetical protein
MIEIAKDLASYRRCTERIHENWPRFLERRQERLAQMERYNTAAEKVAENILEDLFTLVLDWPLSDINNQVRYADLLLTTLGVKHLIIEAKRPGALAWNRRAVEAALEQAQRYASEQKVKCVGVSDGFMIYAADIQCGGIKDRVFASLAAAEPPDDLWWLSVHGIYREISGDDAMGVRGLSETSAGPDAGSGLVHGTLLHPKYGIPAHCFAYVGDACHPGTWKLPYRCADGSVDLKRLPKAIQSILSNYRGAKVGGIPERAIPDVLVRLARAAASVGKMPHQCSKPPAIYCRLADTLEQSGKMAEFISSA